MMRRARNAQMNLLATASCLSVFLLVGLAMLAASPEPGERRVGRQALQDPGTAERRNPYRPEIPLGLDLYLPVPEDNPLRPERVALGRRLFFDPVLSRDRSLACAGCHDPERAFTDGRALCVGVSGRVGTRSVPTIVNRAWGRSFFWDGRISTLEEQVLQPIQDPKELDMPLEDVLSRLRRDREYSERFQAVFGRIPTDVDLANALASYVRTILSGDAPIDLYLGGDLDALSDRAREGLRIFQGKANCSECHLGPTFTDERFHNTGVAWKGPPPPIAQLPSRLRSGVGRRGPTREATALDAAVPSIADTRGQRPTSAEEEGKLVDLGRFEVTGEDRDRGAFKTPTIRNVERTAPYMHDGSLATLDAVIDCYTRGGNANPYRDPEIRPLDLTAEEKQALLTFLRSLSGSVRDGI